MHLLTTFTGFIQDLITTPANVSEGKMLESLLEKANPSPFQPLLADKGYDSKKNRELLADKGLFDGIMRRHAPKKSRDPENSKRNKLLSKGRFVVERTIGYLKLRLRSDRSRYYGLEKTHNYNLMGALAHNLVRTVNIRKYIDYMQTLPTVAPVLLSG